MKWTQKRRKKKNTHFDNVELEINLKQKPKEANRTWLTHIFIFAERRKVERRNKTKNQTILRNNKQKFYNLEAKSEKRRKKKEKRKRKCR